MGIQRNIDVDTIQKRGEAAKAKRGENVWHWDGMSDDEDDDWREAESVDGESQGDEDDEEYKKSKQRLCFQDFDNLWILLDAAGGNESMLLAALERVGASSDAAARFKSLKELAAAVEAAAGASAVRLKRSGPDYSALFPYAHEEGALVMLNMLYAPRKSRLFSIMKVLGRIEHAGHICAWAKCSKLKVKQSSYVF
jgi:hypothetical protein